MKHKILNHAKIVVAADGSKQLFVDTGTDLIPLNNRLAYSETGELQILPKTDVSFWVYDGMDVPLAVAELPLLKIVGGHEYTVLCGEQTYTCTSMEFEEGACVLGNLGYFMGEPEFDTGEPFCIISAPSEGMSMMGITPAVPCTIPVCISTIGEVIHTIDKKYLPEDIGGSGGSDDSDQANLHFLRVNSTDIDLSKYSDGDILFIFTS